MAFSELQNPGEIGPKRAKKAVSKSVENREFMRFFTNFCTVENGPKMTKKGPKMVENGQKWGPKKTPRKKTEISKTETVKRAKCRTISPPGKYIY
jgi:hypothetical protein